MPNDVLEDVVALVLQDESGGRTIEGNWPANQKQGDNPDAFLPSEGEERIIRFSAWPCGKQGALPAQNHATQSSSSSMGAKPRRMVFSVTTRGSMKCSR